MRKSLTLATLAAAAFVFAAPGLAFAGCGASAHSTQQSVQGAQTAQTPLPEKPAETKQ
ncbi:MAG: hypothetical protein WD489_05570 [Rhodovibrionaceae bacterium]